MADNRPWSRGDLALCVDDEGINHPSVRRGGIYTVRSIHKWATRTYGIIQSLSFKGIKTGFGDLGFLAERFRRIDPLSDQEEAEFRSDLANDRVITLVERA